MEKVKKTKLIVSIVLVLAVAVAVVIGQLRKRAESDNLAISEQKGAKSSKENSIEENLLAIKALKAYASDAQKRQKEIQDALAKLKNETEQFKQKATQQQPGVKDQEPAAEKEKKPDATRSEAVGEMLIVTAQKTDSNKTIIPAGSYARCRLLHGFYAPVQYEYSVPAVLEILGDIRTPAGTAISLPDARIVCRAQGDANSERGLLQGVSLSVEGTKSSSQTNGYVVDNDGVVGVKGKYVYNATGEIVLKAIAGAARGIGQFSQFAVVGNVLTGRQAPGQALGSFAEGGAMSGAGQAIEGIAEKRASEFIPSVFVSEGGYVTYYFLSDTEALVSLRRHNDYDETTFSIADR